MNYRILLLLSIFITIISCEKVTIEDETFGSIQGTVIDSETDLPINKANITTTPPTNSILTAEDGTYRLDEIPVGNYSIQARKNKFQNNSVSVAVRENQVATANIVLAPEEEEPDTTSSSEKEISW
ncbi:MAG: carboxypeptidase-like regulatory domain-containing protein [Balneolaceae bacterium]|nr:carboxypeptidase-like regulatory domain-containing protein [Balneolaceae bacterium]MDR9408021.1 carboxypeptidase-like regulatory domain-containing protein [Balneolaceae bacterium]